MANERPYKRRIEKSVGTMALSMVLAGGVALGDCDNDDCADRARRMQTASPFGGLAQPRTLVPLELTAPMAVTGTGVAVDVTTFEVVYPDAGRA